MQKEIRNTVDPENRMLDITADEARALDSFKNYSEEQIQQLINTIKTFTLIGYAIFSKQQTPTGKMVDLPINKNKKNAA